MQALGLEVAAAVGVVSRLVTRDHGLQPFAVMGVGDSTCLLRVPKTPSVARDLQILANGQ